MAHPETVIGTLTAAGKAADPAQLSQGMESLGPAGEQFVRVGLMSYIPDQLIPAGMKNLQQSQGKLNHSQGRSQMAACPGYGLDDDFPEFRCQGRKILKPQCLNILGRGERQETARRVTMRRAL